MLMRAESPVLKNTAEYPDVETIYPGKARGQLVGGNSVVYASLIGSEFCESCTVRANLLSLIHPGSFDMFVIANSGSFGHSEHHVHRRE